MQNMLLDVGAEVHKQCWLVKDFSGEVETNMNEGDKVFARESAALYEFIERSRRALLDDPDERKQELMLDFPKPKVSVESLEENVKNGLSLRLAEDSYYRIERSAMRHVYNCIKTRRSSDSSLLRFVRGTGVKSHGL
jgi:hypothetical protein